MRNGTLPRMRSHLTYANLAATAALLVSLTGGVALAANQLAPHSVGTKELQNNAVKSSKVKNGSGSAPDPADPPASHPSGPGAAPHPVAGSRAGVTAQAPPPQPS